MSEPLFNTRHCIYKSVNRLACYRKKADECRKDFTAGTNWRYWKRTIWQTPNTARGTDGQLFSDSVDQCGDYLGDSDTLVRIDHNGWYSDNYQDGTIKGGVSRLRTARGTLYIPVTYSTAWDGTIHYLNDAVRVDKGSDQDTHNDAIRDAARLADECARIEAEEAREHDAEFQAENDINEARETIHSVNQKALLLIREIKQHGAFSPGICSALREKLSDYLTERREQFDLIIARQSDPWSAVNNY